MPGKGSFYKVLIPIVLKLIRVTLAREPTHKRLKFDLSLVLRSSQWEQIRLRLRTLYYTARARPVRPHLRNWRNSVSVSIQFSFYYVPARAALPLSLCAASYAYQHASSGYITLFTALLTHFTAPGSPRCAAISSSFKCKRSITDRQIALYLSAKRKTCVYLSDL